MRGLKALLVSFIFRLSLATSAKPSDSPAAFKTSALSYVCPLIIEFPTTKQAWPPSGKTPLSQEKTDFISALKVSIVAPFLPLLLNFRWLPISRFLNPGWSMPSHTIRVMWYR